jgi:hypothetical protein
LMRKCGAIKANGERCGRIVGASQVYCYAHDPSNADKRSRDAAKAGRSTPNSELKEMKASLKGLTEKVLTGGWIPVRRRSQTSSLTLSSGS